jgi:hypothetical protein
LNELNETISKSKNQNTLRVEEIAQKKVKTFSDLYKMSPELNLKTSSTEYLILKLPLFFVCKSKIIRLINLRHSSFKCLYWTIVRILKENRNIDINKDTRFAKTYSVVDTISYKAQHQNSNQSIQKRKSGKAEGKIKCHFCKKEENSPSEFTRNNKAKK